MHQYITRGFADELSKLAVNMPGQGMLRRLKAEGLAEAAIATNKASQRAGKKFNIAPLIEGDLPKAPKIPGLI